ncbi:U6 snRNA-associated Sm-like protein LSm7 [Oscarella lobularis]|uniref:U6 snRNA-associated Sm-like protein LSm7 n=1 Tax=Oscarella lobularis TaxID=121494 RepID=UPI003313B1D6
MAQFGDKKKKETILEFTKFVDKVVRVKFLGGREVSGILKGFDPLINLVLDDATEYLRDSEDLSRLSDETRSLGLIVCRGPTVIALCPADSMEQIANPFLQQETS